MKMKRKSCETGLKLVRYSHWPTPKQNRQCMYNVILRRVRVTIAAVENMLFWESAALVMQHAKRMRRVILLSVACQALPSSILFHNEDDFRGRKQILNIKSVLWFSLQLLPEIFFILRKIHRRPVINVLRSSCKEPVIRAGFLWNLNFLDSFSKNPQMSTFLNIRPVGANMFHDRQTDRRTGDKANNRFSQLYRNVKNTNKVS